MPFALIWPFISGKLWPLILKYLPWIIAIAILIGIYVWIDHRGFERGAESRQPEINAITLDRDTYKGNADRMSVSLDMQSKASADLSKQEAAKLAEAQEALAQSRRNDVARQVSIDKLKVSAAKPVLYPCEASDTTKEMWR